jgi:hypothetical protein
MAKRRSREQIDADKIIKEYLNELGEKVYQQATETSRRDTGVCKMNRIIRYNPILLTFGQMVYGQWNYPKEYKRRKERFTNCD